MSTFSDTTKAILKNLLKDLKQKYLISAKDDKYTKALSKLCDKFNHRQAYNDLSESKR